MRLFPWMNEMKSSWTSDAVYQKKIDQFNIY